MDAPIRISADRAYRWRQDGEDVWLLQGGCEIAQGETTIRGEEAVAWIERPEEKGGAIERVAAFVSRGVVIDQRGKAGGGGREDGRTPSGAESQVPGPRAPSDKDRQTAVPWFGRLYSDRAVEFQVRQILGEPPVKPALYQAAVERRSPPRTEGIQRTQFSEFAPERIAPPQTSSPVVGSRRVQVFPRSGVPIQAQFKQNPANPSEWIATINTGVKMRVDSGGVSLGGFGTIGSTIDIEADRIVIWTTGELGDFARGTSQAENVPLEVYLEGDVVFREGDRVVFAQSMYYNVAQRTGIILNAEVVTPVPNYAGILRLRTDVLRQVNEGQFVAEGASITTSRLAMPTYEFRSGTLTFQDVQSPLVNPLTREPVLDPVTGQPQIAHQQMATSVNNVGYVEGIPVFYWPRLATDLKKPTFYIEKLLYRNDQIFGNQIITQFDLYQILGIQSPPDGTDWNLGLNYFSERGPAASTRFTYDRDFLFQSDRRTFGLFDAFFINDTGLDNLGLDRMALIPPTENRGRVLSRNRFELPENLTLTAELGYISDRNFLEQYFEQEWDEQKDQITGLELRQTIDNRSWALAVDARTQDIFLQTQQLPRLDHFWLGQSLFGDRVTWYEHTSVGYFNQNQAQYPSDPQDAAQFGYLPYEVPTTGERIATRHEFDLPLSAGPVKLVPYLLGEAAHWGEDLNGEGLQRVYGQAGLRASLPVWSVDPTVENSLFNLHGLAHKVVFRSDLSYTDASQNLDQLPIYDEIDDDSTQAFRRRLTFQDFGGPPPVPSRYDERFYAVRRGLQDNVTGPTEIADDLAVIRLGIEQRWQTKRGPLENRRIIDWITFDTHAEVFPDADQNFGENLGLVDYDFRWHVGDRVTLLSSGAADFFDEGQRYLSVGGFLSRPPRGNVFLGFRSLEGPIHSNVLITTYNYRMSPKWVSSFGLMYDFNKRGYLGQSLTLTRIGESFLFSIGLTADQSKDNVGIALALEPRFFPQTAFGRRTGIIVPPAGAFGLE